MDSEAVEAAVNEHYGSPPHNGGGPARSYQRKAMAKVLEAAHPHLLSDALKERDEAKAHRDALVKWLMHTVKSASSLSAAKRTVERALASSHPPKEEA